MIHESPKTQDTSEKIVKRSTRRAMVAGVLAGCAALIGFVVGWGNPDNTLHTSALSWAFTLSGAMLGGYLFGATWENVKLGAR